MAACLQSRHTGSTSRRSGNCTTRPFKHPFTQITMDESSKVKPPIEHGRQCSCTLLALATGLDPRKLSFEYCHRVLHKRWGMTCRHGQRETAPVSAALGERWHDVGPVDSVKAILISNDQRDE